VDGLVCGGLRCGVFDAGVFEVRCFLFFSPTCPDRFGAPDGGPRFGVRGCDPWPPVARVPGAEDGAVEAVLVRGWVVFVGVEGHGQGRGQGQDEGEGEGEGEGGRVEAG